MFRIAGEVVQLVRIRRDIVQLRRVAGAGDVFPPVAPDHEGRLERAFRHVFAEHRVGPAFLRAGREAEQAVAVDRRGIADALAVGRDVAEGRQQVHQRDMLGHLPRLQRLGCVNDHRHAGRVLEEGHLVPEATLAQHVAVVRRHDDDGVVGLAGLLERPQHLPEQPVAVADHGVVAAPGRANVPLGHAIFVAVVEIVHALADRLALRGRDVGHRGKVDLVLAIGIIVRARAEIRVVRLHERDAHHERPLVVAARMVVEPALRGIGDLVVMLHFQRAIVGAGFGHAQHVVEPPMDFLRLLPGRGPAEIAGIHVGGDAILEAVQLVGSDEMHLAGEAGAIAREPQVMREGRDRGGELRRIVPGADPAAQLPGHHGKAARRAQRGVGIGAVELHALRRQPAQVGRLDDLVPVARQELRRQLIEHHIEDVGAALLGKGGGGGFSRGHGHFMLEIAGFQEISGHPAGAPVARSRPGIAAQRHTAAWLPCCANSLTFNLGPVIYAAPRQSSLFSRDSAQALSAFNRRPLRPETISPTSSRNSAHAGSQTRALPKRSAYIEPRSRLALCRRSGRGCTCTERQQNT